MCYHYSLTKIALQSENRFSAMQEDYNIIEEYDNHYHINGFTFPQVPVVASDDPTKIQLMSWGLIPQWVKTKDDALKFRQHTLNARSDTMYEKPSYRGACKVGNRCIIPVSGIFEWHGYKKIKYPHYIYMKDGPLFYMAGIWDEWVDKTTGEVIKSFSLVTTEANPLMAWIHNDGQRMPVILPMERQMDWLDSSLSKEEVLAMTISYDQDKMDAHPISKIFSSRTAITDIPEITEAVYYPELAEERGGLF